jgi:molybdopterin/thiamine biosynthesis adenylyltransferase
VVDVRRGTRDGQRAQCLVIVTALAFKGQPVPVEVAFPYDYPDAPPALLGPPGLLDRHQQPFSGDFCLFEDSDADWWPATSAAELVAKDLRQLFEDSEQGREVVLAGEAPMAEPLTGHLRYGTSVVIVPDPYWRMELPSSGGSMTLRHADERYVLTRASHLGEADPRAVNAVIEQWEELEGWWVALDDGRDLLGLPDSVLSVVDAAQPRVFGRLARWLKEHRSEQVAQQWLGLTFIEEGPRQGEQRRAWAFAMVQLDRDGGRLLYPWMRAQALTPSERERRIPELVGLDTARVLLIGAGSLGAPVACELAKAGTGRVVLVDPDAYDVNNSVRHVVGVRWAGGPKAGLVAALAQEFNPFGTVEAHSHLTVGAGQDEAARIDALIADTDVVVDTTGSQSVARILQRRCRAHDKTLVVAGLSAGSYGGEVIVLRADGACFNCFALAQRDENVPTPRAAKRVGVTPIGCSHPAFSGAGFDATELAAVTARTVVQATGTSRYPAAGWDWAVVNFRGEPRWETGTLEPHPECSICL